LWGALLVGITALLARALFDQRTGLTAGVIAAIYPPLVAHSHYLWSEMLFASLLGAALVLVVRAQARPGATLAVAAGLLFGTAMLAREIAGLVAVVCALWWWRAAPNPERRQALGRGALMLVCMLLVVAPWTVRNYQRLGGFVPVSTIGWFAAAEGNTLDHPSWLASIGPEGFAFRQQYFGVQGEMERVAFARGWLLERVAAEQPTWIFKKLVRGTAQLFSPESYLLYKLARGAYGEVSMGWARSTLIFSVAIYLVLISAAVLGVVSARREHRRSLACAILGVVLAVHVLANSGPRFRVPLMPLLIAYASYALLDLRARLGGLGRGERVAVGLALTVFFGLCVPYYWSDAAALWTSGSQAIPR
jgi:4-amino-4-deoxy-L-arabinose transferase-like glycosyltransferase